MRPIEVIYIIGNLELYKTFYFVAQLGSLTKAAELLFITQPSVSYSVKQLEEQLGLPLFIRKAKGVQLTKEGELLYRHISEAFESIFTAESKLLSLKSLAMGEIKIGTSDTLCKYFLLPQLESFHRFYPEIKIHLSHGKTPDILTWLSKGLIDCGMVHLPVDEDAFDVIRLASVHDCFVAGEKYKHLATDKHYLANLLQYPIITLPKNSSTRAFIDHIAETQAMTLEPVIELGSVDLLIECARIGLGISFISREFIKDQLNKGLLHEVQTVEEIPERQVGIAVLRGGPRSEAARKLISQLVSDP